MKSLTMKALALLSVYVLFTTSLLAQTQTAVYQPSDEVFPNPERGWYKLWFPNFDNSNKVISDADLQTLKGDGNGTRLVLHKIIIPNNGPIPPSLIEELQQEANRVRSNGFKIIYRFTYNWNQSISIEDASLSQIEAHLDQLAPFFETNNDIIAFIEPGFVGSFGEWHHSSNDLLEAQTTTRLTDASRQVMSKILQVLPPDRITGMRYPHLKWVLTASGYPDGGLGYDQPLTEATAYSGSDASRIGYYNQRFVTNIEDMWSLTVEPSPERDYPLYMSQDTKFAPSWGEPEESSYAHQKKSGQRAIDEARMFHYLSLNGYRESSPIVYQTWENTGAFAELSKKLGYRFRLLETEAPTNVNAGETLSLTLQVANDGFSRPVNARSIEVVLRDLNDGNTIVIPFSPTIDTRLWLPGAESQKLLNITVPIPDGVAEATYEVLLNLPDPYASLKGNPDYSIRLANQDIWEATTGYNKLNLTVDISADGNTSDGSGTGLSYSVYDNQTLSGSTIETGVDATVDFNWQSGGKATNLPSDNFSVRWTGQVRPQYSETYTFYTQADDGTRLWVNGELLIDDWTNHAVREKQGQITLQAGEKYDIKLEYFENKGKAVCKLLWKSPSQSKQIIPSANLFASNTNSARSSNQLPAKLSHPTATTEASSVSIYPNPSIQGAIMVSGVSEESQIQMFDIQGCSISITQRLMSEQRVQLQPNATLPRGLYVVQIRQPNGNRWQRRVMVGE